MKSDEEKYSISHEGGATSGSEQFADRPAVVVSNDENNMDRLQLTGQIF